MKRFYDDAGTRQVDAGWQVTLDGRGLKTVKGTPQIVPAQVLADALAKEWAEQTEELDPKSFVFRDMADYAIDVIAPDPEAATEKLTAYGDTDTLLYRADPDEALYARQMELWDPIVTAFEAHHGVTLTRISGVVHREQPASALATLKSRLDAQSAFALAGIETMTSLAASLIIGLSASQADADVLALWRAASLEEEWQADLWGRDYEAEDRRAKREAAFLKAAEFTRLAQLPK